MSRLSEVFVQRSALAYLRERYDHWARRGRIFVDDEVRTVDNFGGYRADGLVVLRHVFWGVFVVSMEAKSFRTLAAIRPTWRWQLWVVNSLRAGFLIAFLSGAFFFLFRWDDGHFQYLLPASAFVLGSLAYGVITRNHIGHKTADMIKQIEQYPAHVKWLACSEDSLDRLTGQQQQVLRTLCRHFGIGLLVVDSEGDTRVWLRASLKLRLINPLRYYARASAIRQRIRAS